jgi:hypothetical protein
MHGADLGSYGDIVMEKAMQKTDHALARSAPNLRQIK